MNILINYANEKYQKAQKLNSWTGRYIAKLDKVIEYSEDNIDDDFRQTYQEIFTYARGNGLWLWKPYIILKALHNLQNGDKLLYLDSGAFWIRNAKPILDLLDREWIYVTNLPLIEKQFTKISAFTNMDCEGKQYSETQQIQASIVGIKKTNESVEFVEKWLAYCCQIEIISSDINNEKEYKDFIAHREDQSVLSLLCKKHGIKPHLDPTQYGRLPEMYHQDPKWIFFIPRHYDSYKPIIVLHRHGNAKLSTCIKQWLYCVLPFRVSNAVWLIRKEIK